MRTQYKQPSHRKKYLVVGLVVAVIAAAAGVYYGLVRNDSPGTAVNDSGINYGPPTDVEKKETEDHKDELLDNPPASIPSTVTPTIVTATYSTDNQQAIVGGFVQGVLEEGGTCKLSLTREGVSGITRSESAVTNVNRTECPPFIIARSDFPTAGTWNAVLSYSSAKTSGESLSKELLVP